MGLRWFSAIYVQLMLWKTHLLFFFFFFEAKDMKQMENTENGATIF